MDQNINIGFFFVLFFKITNQEFLHNPLIYKKNWDLGKEPSLITQEHQM